jgi:hypothetical protein
MKNLTLTSVALAQNVESTESVAIYVTDERRDGTFSSSSAQRLPFAFPAPVELIEGFE